MSGDYYIPGLPQNLEAFHYTPKIGAADVKALRAKYAGMGLLLIGSAVWHEIQVLRGKR